MAATRMAYFGHAHGAIATPVLERGDLDNSPRVGPLIVEEREPIRVDRDVTWVLDDWRLLPDAQISDDFGNFMDSSHNGRVGNSVTVNGRIQETFAVRAGERLRLRLINAANARIFGLEFRDHRPTVVALDGQPGAGHGGEFRQVEVWPAQFGRQTGPRPPRGQTARPLQPIRELGLSRGRRRICGRPGPAAELSTDRRTRA